MNKYTEHETSYCSKLNLLLAADSVTLSEHGKFSINYILIIFLFN